MKGRTLRSMVPNDDESELWRRLVDGRSMANEYDGLESAELAWIHGRTFGGSGSSMVIGKGVDRMQRLAFTSWLESYFVARFSSTIINLNTIQLDADAVKKDSSELIKYSRAMAASGGLGSAASTTDVVAQLSGQPALSHGIFTMDKGPFLRGKVNDNSLVELDVGLAAKWAVPNNLSDSLAFEGLYSKMKELNLFEWSPDGMVLSKLESPAGDPIGSTELDAREAQLFNVAVQGPAIAKTWTGDAKMQCLPMDKVFVVIQADVLTDWDEADVRAAVEAYQAVVANYIKEIRPDEGSDLSGARKTLDDTFFGGEFNEVAWDQRAGQVKIGNGGGILTNFHLRRVTSSYLTMYSAYKKGNKHSRCGLADKIRIKTPQAAARYIIGGWCIGTVLDSAASRGSIGNQIKLTPASMALNINVNIEWWSGDKLHRHYMDVDGTVLGRQDDQKKPRVYAPVNRKETGRREVIDEDDFLPAVVDAKRRAASNIDHMEVDA
jgi:hypothetical protein